MKRTLSLISVIIVVVACSDNDGNANAIKPVPLPDSVLTKRWEAIKVLKDSIREGDLVLRCGNDHISESLRDFSQQEKLYSHSGLAFRHNGEMLIYSNMAGDINPNEVMRRDNVDSFLTPVNNVAAGVYRYDLSHEELQKLKGIAETHYNNKLQFDMNFDLSTDDKMYCAELISKAVENASGKRISFSTSLINKSLKEKYLKKLLEKKIVPSAKMADQKEYIALDNLYFNSHCKEVLKVVFGEPQKPIKFPTPENYQQ